MGRRTYEMTSETMPYFEIITEMTEYLMEHYEVQENMIFELIKRGSWEIALKKDGDDEIELRKTSTYKIDQAMQLFKNQGTYEDYIKLIDYIIMSFPHIGINDSEKKAKAALIKIIRKHTDHGDALTTANSDYDHTSSHDASSKIPSNAILTGKNVYGGLFLARFPYVIEHFGSPGMDNLLKEMINNGYKGPKTIKEINRSVKYPLKNLCIYNKAFFDLYGEEHFKNMMADSAKRKGIVAVFVKWAGTPEMITKKAPEYWTKFYDFGSLESRLKEDGRGIIRLLDGRVNLLFCKSLTSYFEGVGKAIGYELDVKHTMCIFKGNDYCEWDISWNKFKIEVTAPTSTKSESRQSMEKDEVIPAEKSFTGGGALQLLTII